MAIRITHPFVSPVHDKGDPNLVGPDEWNDDHTITGTLPVENGGTGQSTDVRPLTDSAVENGPYEPIYGPFTGPQGYYDASSNRTYICWHGLREGAACTQARFYDHDTEEWSDSVVVTPASHVDDHNSPAIIADYDGYLHFFEGEHIADQHEYISTSPGDITSFTLNQTFAGSFTYPHLAMVGRNLYYFIRNGTGGSSSLSMYHTTNITNGVSTWASPISIFDWTGTDGIYLTGAIVRDQYIHLCAKRGSANDLFYAKYDTVSGSLTNISGTTTVAAGSLPVNYANSVSNFKVITAYPEYFNAMTLDSDDNPHFIYQSSANPGATQGVYHQAYISGSLTAVHVLQEVADQGYPGGSAFDGRAMGCLVPLADGVVQAYWATNPFVDTTSSIYTATRAADGTWTSSSVFREADVLGFCDMATIESPHANARVMFGEGDIDYLLSNALARVFVYGDNGYLRANPNDEFRRLIGERGLPFFRNRAVNSGPAAQADLGTVGGAGFWIVTRSTASGGPFYVTFFDPSTAPASAVIGGNIALARNSTQDWLEFASYSVKSESVTAGAETAHWEFWNKRSGADALQLILADGVTVGNQSYYPGYGALAVDKFVEVTEMSTAPAAGVADTARIFARDNGGGKTQLCVRYGGGGIVVLSTEP